MIETGGPTLFLTLVALGWANGLLGMLGIGRLRPGWLTIGGTLILGISLAYAFARQRHESAQPHTGA